VRVAPLAEVIAAHSAHVIVELPCRDPQAVIAAAASQIGKPYDYTAILGLGLRRDWQEEDAWFCSELVAWAFQHAGEPLFRAECLRRVTPQHLWMLAPAPPPPDPALLAPIEGRLVRPSSF
jgi:cell wall-associated NlpC family hydrolase